MTPLRCPSCHNRVAVLLPSGVCWPCSRDTEPIVPDLAERTRPADADEIEARLAAVRAAKADRGVLTPDDLDAILPPLDDHHARARARWRAKKGA